MLQTRYDHTGANFKFYGWLSEDAKKALERGLAGLEDWQQERASGQPGAALRSSCWVKAWPGWGGRAAFSRASMRCANHGMKLAVGGCCCGSPPGFLLGAVRGNISFQRFF